MSSVISDCNVLVHSVLPSLPADPHPTLFISLHFRAQRAPAPPPLHPTHPSVFAECVCVSFACPTSRSYVHRLAIRLPGSCIADLSSHPGIRMFFSRPVILLDLRFNSPPPAAALYAPSSVPRPPSPVLPWFHGDVLLSSARRPCLALGLLEVTLYVPGCVPAASSASRNIVSGGSLFLTRIGCTWHL